MNSKVNGKKNEQYKRESNSLLGTLGAELARLQNSGIIDVVFDSSEHTIIFTVSKSYKEHLTTIIRSNFKVIMQSGDDLTVYGWSSVGVVGTLGGFVLVKKAYRDNRGVGGIFGELLFYVGGYGTALLSYQVVSRIPTISYMQPAQHLMIAAGSGYIS